MIRILNAEPLNYSVAAAAILRTVGQIDLIDLPRGKLIKTLSEYNGLIVRLRTQIDQEVIDAGLNLKVIATATTGLDHIDLEYAETRGIKILSLCGRTEFLRQIPATVEHTWGLLLSLRRCVPWAFQSVLNGQWERDVFKGHDLAGQRLGIVGLGRIGEKIAMLGQAFGMQVGAYDPYRPKWISDVEKFDKLPNLLQRTDVLSLHVPLNAETENLITGKELALLPQGASLINTARGEILDEMALLDHLKGGHLSGAALDVIRGERNIDHSVNPLIEYAQQHNNLLITPHIGGATYESMQMTEVFMAEQVKLFFQENPLKII